MTGLNESDSGTAGKGFAAADVFAADPVLLSGRLCRATGFLRFQAVLLPAEGFRCRFEGREQITTAAGGRSYSAGRW